MKKKTPTRNKFTTALIQMLLPHKSASTALTIHTPTDLVVQERPLPIPHQPEPAIIDLSPLEVDPVPLPLSPIVEETEALSNFLRIGLTYHPLCRNAFVERVQIGYYAYERRDEWRTCTLAAAYAGAFGPDSIEKPAFSYSMAVWRLSQRVGFDIDKHQVTGPTGRQNNLADEMIKLTDDNLWTRSGVAEWLESLGV